MLRRGNDGAVEGNKVCAAEMVEDFDGAVELELCGGVLVVFHALDGDGVGLPVPCVYFVLVVVHETVVDLEIVTVKLRAEFALYDNLYLGLSMYNLSFLWVYLEII